MENLTFLEAVSWIAIVLLSVSYWFQIWKIHVHKEVRDLSMTYHVFKALGFGILTWTAWVEGSIIFVVKQVSTTIPVLILIGQIIYHKDDHWHDEKDPDCTKCGEELELDWSFCAYCGEGKPEGLEKVAQK
ncbi:MAG: zinc-ribbon domain-containing protein [Bacteriovoracaceae bacterium]|nr:zinc-ribbon domain-containing protein [Bacteriovoracaceae bacterium]